MRHRHRWPYILSLPLLLFLPSLLAVPSPSPAAKTRHHQRQLHRLVGGHFRISETDQDDSELITASAGGDNKSSKQGKSGSDERKTLSQQVADGKYGLIQKELFKKTPKRPGILSYSANPEVPKDNIATLGGLTKNDIWLAENHLLVIKGGNYPPHDDTKQDYVGQIWQPIDDYNAPLHQVKIPKNPKIPPPFPVQLTDDGPLQILGTNTSRTLNASAETPAYALPPPPGWDGEIPPQSEYFPQTDAPNSDPSNPAAGKTPLRNLGSGEPPGGMPFPPVLLNGSLPPSFAHLPPGAAILPAPLGNETDSGILDEDDPSIYYPPPYSFYYPRDNSSVVPPGPLVPGIILPPPPKFFAPLEEESVTTTTSTTTRKPLYTTKHTIQQTTTESPLSNEISTFKSYKTIPTRVSVVKNYSKVTVRVNTSRRPQDHSRGTYRARPQTTKLIKTTIPTTGKPKLITILPVHVDKLNRTYLPTRVLTKTRTKPPVTILRPVKPEVATPKIYLYQNEVSDRPFNKEREQKNEFDNQRPDLSRVKDQNNRNTLKYDNQRQSFDKQRPNSYDERQKTRFNDGYISTTQVPLKYQTTMLDIRVNSVTPEPEKFSIGTRGQSIKTTPKLPANFYFYEETDPALNDITTANPHANQNSNYYDIPKHHYYPIDFVKTTTPAPPLQKPHGQHSLQYYYPDHGKTTTEQPLTRKPVQTSVPNQYYYPAHKNPITPQPTFRKPSLQPHSKPQYIYVSGRPYESQKPKFRYVSQAESRPQQNSFSVHIAKLQNQLHQYYTTSKPVNRPSSKPVYQYSFEAQNYRRPVGGSFRPSPLIDDNDENSFRPVQQYSVEIQPAIEIIPTHRPSYQQIQPLDVEEPTYYSTERPQSGHSYSTKRPQHGYSQQYHEISQVNQNYQQNKDQKGQTNHQEKLRRPIYNPEHHGHNQIVPEIQGNPDIAITPSKAIAEFSFEVTPNPIHQGYYTKPDEGYFDENTKQYFTIFGRKLPTATTPIPNVKRPSLSSIQSGIRQHNADRYKQELYDRPISLQSDINVNYIKPRPPINPLSEHIHPGGQYQENHSPNPEVVKALEITPAVSNERDKERYIHYQLPGDEGAHFYFLTPQAAERRQGYFYERERRIKREEKNGEKKR